MNNIEKSGYTDCRLMHPHVKRMLRAAAVLIIAAFAIITQTGCGNKEVSKTDFVLNTSSTITIYGMNESDGEEILSGAFKEIRRYENLLSRTIEGSDIYNINHADGAPTEVSDETIEVIKLGIEMGDISDGGFDITVGRLTEMWNFTGENPHVPEQSAIDEAVRSVGYKNIIVEGNTVTLKDAGAAIDLGGVAKGYIADRITEYLEENGVSSAVINLGGNVVVLGSKEDGSAWNVGIERPYSDHTEVIGSIKTKDATVVTSGTYERKFEEDGVLYHHVLDPATGYPADTDLESVTITAERGSSGFCDGLSTICLLSGKEKAVELIKELQEKYPEMGLEAAFIDKNDDIVQTEGMNITPAED